MLGKSNELPNGQDRLQRKEMLPLNGLLGPSKEPGLTLMGVRSSILAFGAT